VAARALAASLILLGCLVLLGWWRDIPTLRSVLPGFVSMRPNTAAGFAISGLALLALCMAASPLGRVARVLGALVALLGTVSLGQNLLGLPLEVDGWIFDVGHVLREGPARMATMTALCFVLCGNALASGRGWLGARAARRCALGAGFLSLLALFGYLFDVQALQHLGAYRSMALHTVFGMLLLVAGLLLALPRRSAERPLQLAAAVALAALVSVGWIVADRLDSLVGSDRGQTRTEQALHELDRLFSTLVDAESALRGYFLTEDELQLEIFHRAVLSTQGRLETAQRLLADYPEQSLRLQALAAPIRGMLASMQGDAELMRQRGFEAARESMREMWRNKADMLRIRQDIFELQAQQQRLLEQHVAAKETDIRRTRLTLVVGGAFGTLVLLCTFVLLWRENTRRKSSEAELQAAHDYFRDFVLRSPIAMAYVDAEGRITLRNEQFLATFGYGEAEVPGVDDWWPKAYPDPEYRAWVLDTWNSALHGAVAQRSAIASAEYRVTCVDGQVRDMEISGVRLDRGWLITFVDVTQRRQAEAELVVRREEAEAASRAKSAFLANRSACWSSVRLPRKATSGTRG
jgi:PAS domain S-box-containing protein